MKSLKRKAGFFLILSFITLLLYSCATMSGTKNVEQKVYKPGIWHRVEEGQTLWRISKTYGVSLEIIKEANEITDVLHIRPGTWIFIPGAKKHLYVQGGFDKATNGPQDFKIVLPVNGRIIRKFGKIKNDFNYGIDIKVIGGRYVLSSQKGKVVFSGVVRGYGYVVIIDHGNGYYSLYTKNIEPVVKEGESVKINSVIAKINREGGSEAVVHYELYYKGKPVNPLYYVE